MLTNFELNHIRSGSILIQFRLMILSTVFSMDRSDSLHNLDYIHAWSILGPSRLS